MNCYVSIVLAIACFMLGVNFGTLELQAASVQQSSVVNAIQERGYVLCGVRNDMKGFSVVDRNGRWSGLDVDFCAALAVAVLGSKDAVKYRPLSNVQRYSALAAGEVDVIAGGAVWTLTRDTELGVRFVDTLFHDGQVFLVRKEQAVSSALELSGTSICALDSTRAASGVERFFGSRKMPYVLDLKKHWKDALDTYRDGDCNVLTGDLSVIASERLRLPNPDQHQILPEVVSKEPLGLAVKKGDEIWFSIVRWTLMVLIEAEELGVSSENISQFKTSKMPREQQLLGIGAEQGAPMGLSKDWAYQVISQVGNYSELFERNLGEGSNLKLERGINALWNKGGLMYGVPLR